MSNSLPTSLADRIAASLTEGVRLTLHYLACPPSPCDEIFSAPPNEAAEPTTCEPHFLSASVSHEDGLVQVFGVEVLVYRAETLTTIFVSKADSTGYLYLGVDVKPVVSPIRAVAAAFLEFLVDENLPTDRRLLLALFARAQDQYLFPGSIENSRKHVLNDRNLIKWWCRILDSVLAKHPVESLRPNSGQSADGHSISAQGYVIVPGCEAHETRSFFPRTNRSSISRWSSKDPLRGLGKKACLPERCLIPRFPDDPKARYVTDLDDELPQDGSETQDSPAKTLGPGKWRSVRSLDQFWEMMAFRQECAAGRLVGFIWAVFEPHDLIEKPFTARVERREESFDKKGETKSTAQLSSTPTMLTADETAESEEKLEALPNSETAEPENSPENLKQSLPDGLVRSRDSGQEQPMPDGVSKQASKAELTLLQVSYKAMIDCLSELDYSNVELAIGSTAKFLSNLSDNGSILAQKFEVNGRKAEKNLTTQIEDGNKADGVAILSAGLVRKKRRPTESEAASSQADAGDSKNSTAKTLDAGLIRKKPKV